MRLNHQSNPTISPASGMTLIDHFTNFNKNLAAEKAREAREPIPYLSQSEKKAMHEMESRFQQNAGFTKGFFK